MEQLSSDWEKTGKTQGVLKCNSSGDPVNSYNHRMIAVRGDVKIPHKRMTEIICWETFVTCL